MWSSLIRPTASRPLHKPINPKPSGQIEADGATAALLRVLAEAPHAYLTYREIHARLDRPKSLNWALRYCRARKWVEITTDPRSARYRRYRITSIGMELFHD